MADQTPTETWAVIYEGPKSLRLANGVARRLDMPEVLFVCHFRLMIPGLTSPGAFPQDGVPVVVSALVPSVHLGQFSTYERRVRMLSGCSAFVGECSLGMPSSYTGCQRLDLHSSTPVWAWFHAGMGVGWLSAAPAGNRLPLPDSPTEESVWKSEYAKRFRQAAAILRKRIDRPRRPRR